MPNLSKATIRKMRRVIAAVKANAKYYNQDNFPMAEDCGTSCCAAGFAVWLSVPKKRYDALVKSYDGDGDGHWSRLAQAELGLPWVKELFDSPDWWPDKFSNMYRTAKGPAGRAKALEAYWEYFIDNDGNDAAETNTRLLDASMPF